MHPYPRLFTHANARLQRTLSTEARLDLAVLTFVITWLDEEKAYAAWEDVLYLANYGLITTCPN